MRKSIKRFIRNFKKDERGLTLVELLAVVVILAIIGTIAFVIIGNVVENSKQDAHVANAQQMISAAKLAESSGELVFTETKSSVAATDLTTLEPLTNPWTKNSYSEGASVSKNIDTNVYSVTLSSGNNDCDINHSEEDINKGREEVCK